MACSSHVEKDDIVAVSVAVEQHTPDAGWGTGITRGVVLQGLQTGRLSFIYGAHSVSFCVGIDQHLYLYLVDRFFLFCKMQILIIMNEEASILAKEKQCCQGPEFFEF